VSSKVKYSQLEDKSWLYNMYIKKHIPVEKIDDIIGCSRGAVYYALKKYKMTVKVVQRCEQLQKLLKNKKWLKKKYVKQGKTSTDIATELNLADTNYAKELIKKALIKFKIKKHSRRYLRMKNSNNKDYFKINKDIIDGGLLGDATMWVPNNKNESAPMFRRGNKNKDHVEWVAKQLFSKNSHKRISVKFTKLKGKIFKAHIVSSLTHDKLTKYFKRWYPENSGYKKVIPKDCSITPKALLHWFLDDGTTSYIKNKKSVKLSFCTDGFTEKDINFLVKRIYKKYGLIMHINKFKKSIEGKKQYRVLLCGSQTELFYKIIGKCPFKSLAYKWKYPERVKRVIKASNQLRNGPI
jgi:LAGLIDADG DNA endonuclease family